MHEDRQSHEAAVQAWFARVRAIDADADRLALLEHAFNALWRRAQRTLGDVTLAAILDRVLATKCESYPLLSDVRVELSGLVCDRLYERREALPADELSEAMQALLVEFLAILGELTAEILTPALHAELGNVAPEPSTRTAVDASATGDPT